MKSTEISVERLRHFELPTIIKWYKQQDKSWLYCDCPLDLDYSDAESYINSQIDMSFDDLDDPINVNYHSIYKY